jgi:hypothetical protein
MIKAAGEQFPLPSVATPGRRHAAAGPPTAKLTGRLSR